MRGHRTLLGMVVYLAVCFGAGIWAAATPAAEPFVKPVLAVLMMTAGVILLSPFSTSRPTNAPQRAARLRISVLGSSYIVLGIAQLMPSLSGHFVLVAVSLPLMGCAARGLPKRLFAVRSSEWC